MSTATTTITATATTAQQQQHQQQQQQQEPVVAVSTNMTSASCSGQEHNNASLPLVPSWKHGMAGKASGKMRITPWFDLAMTLDGRDKITKLLQYISRFLAWYYGSVKKSSSATATIQHMAERFANLKVALTNSRKAFRLGRTVMELQKVYKMNVIATLLERFSQQQQQQQQQQKSLSSSNNSNNNNNITALIGTAVKCLGLAGFWAGDNVNFLASSGVLDNYNAQDDRRRLQQRKRLATQAGMFANRSYFIGAVAGLIVNARAYRLFRRQARERLWQQQQHKQQIQMDVVVERKDNDNDSLISKKKDATATSSSSSVSEMVVSFQQQQKILLDEMQEKQFTLMVALVKSCCDVLAFSNNPGVDLWEKRLTGRKLNEGIHCVAGMISALTVLYNNFPKQQQQQQNINK
jgi:Peroxisomal biogenesis factor 11 (PEX11)